MISSAGVLKCWGDNAAGQLGTGSTASYVSAPNAVPIDFGGRLVRSASMGGSSGCAVLDDNTVRCWGRNSVGQLGTGTSSSLPSRTPAAPVNLGTPRVMGVTVGYEHACAWLENGFALCWGSNTYGQLGLCSTDRVLSPYALTTPDRPQRRVRSMAASNLATCALLDDGSVDCWGKGAIGDGYPSSQTNPQTAPRRVSLPAGRTALQISATQDSACALLDDRTTTCWGLFVGQEVPGDYAAVPPSTPIDVGGYPVAALDPSAHCVITDDPQRTLHCWGAWSSYTSSTQTLQVTPLAVATGVVSVASGPLHRCAVFTDGTVRCWGINSLGQSGSLSLGRELLTPNLVGSL
jgi:alpha-tubulin suppressor-like RCC1 family protein